MKYQVDTRSKRIMLEQKKERASRKRPSGEFKRTEIMLENRIPRKESK